MKYLNRLSFNLVKGHGETIFTIRLIWINPALFLHSSVLAFTASPQWYLVTVRAGLLRRMIIFLVDPFIIGLNNPNIRVYLRNSHPNNIDYQR